MLSSIFGGSDVATSDVSVGTFYYQV